MEQKYLKETKGSLQAKFGLSQLDITPPLGIYSRNWGAATFDQAVGIHQPLLMHCLYISPMYGSPAILLTADLGWWKNADDERKLRYALLDYFSLSESQLVFTLSHTHAGPSICSADIHQPGGQLIPPYLEFLKKQAIRCIELAKDGLFEGSLHWHYGVCDLASNRDLEVNGQFLIGFNPSQTADHTLLVGQLYDRMEVRKAVICNYACHPTSFAHENELLSPDFIGEMRYTVERALQVPCLFLQGASGDLAPKRQYVKDATLVEANGRQLGYAVLASLAQESHAVEDWVFERPLISGAPLACWGFQKQVPATAFRQVMLSVRVPYKKLPSLEAIFEEYEICSDRVIKDRLWRKYNTRRAIGDQSEAHIPVWLWKMGDAVLVAQANEAYSCYQTKIRAEFPDHTIIFINIANGYVGYLAPSDLYDKDIYAVWQSPYDRGSLEILIEETKLGIQTLLTDETGLD
ncbi:hypothetical protein ABTW24_17730 [Sphingobacterium thalpophilum]|uniref:Neutral/alkaline non-lysosomal ceramidase n=1 Tax=Sphingobacterium thalpophilum TaxID=259 RepID=A0ABV4HHG5_9SPHI